MSHAFEYSAAPTLAWITGPTGAGKSTLLKDAGQRSWIGLVEVGKMMRAKYPPSHFQGQASPAHTQVEAWQMCLDGIAAHTAAGKRLILIDGQPRDYDQLNKTLALPGPRIYIHLWAPVKIREERLLGRDAGNEEALKLSQARLHGDLSSLYNIHASLQSWEEPLFFFDSSIPRYETSDVIEAIVDWYALECGGSLLFMPEEFDKVGGQGAPHVEEA